MDCEENDWSSGFTDDLPDLEIDQNLVKDAIIHEKYGEFICQAKSNLSDLISQGFTDSSAFAATRVSDPEWTCSSVKP